MSSPVSNLLRLPAGSAKLFLQEARNHQLIVQDLNLLYDSWGYLPVHTPLVDYARSYDEFISEKDRQRIYHLIDRDGEVLMLRWDLTHFLLKQVRSLLPEGPAPLRLCYSDTIVRHQEAEDISHNEFYQTGIELIGVSGTRGDLEVLLLLHQSLSFLGLKAAVHVGSRAVFQLAFGLLSAELQSRLSLAISLRDFHEVRKILSESSLEKSIDSLILLFSFIGNHTDFVVVLKTLRDQVHEQLSAECQALADFVKQLCALEKECDIHVDLSELGGQDYYSGVVFKAYVAGVSTAVASGGRYDRLLERQGIPASAAGFSIMLSKISPLIRPSSRSDEELVQTGTSGDFDPISFAAQYEKVQKLRKSGKRVAL